MVGRTTGVTTRMRAGAVARARPGTDRWCDGDGYVSRRQRYVSRQPPGHPGGLSQRWMFVFIAAITAPSLSVHCSGHKKGDPAWVALASGLLCAENCLLRGPRREDVTVNAGTPGGVLVGQCREIDVDRDSKHVRPSAFHVSRVTHTLTVGKDFCHFFSLPRLVALPPRCARPARPSCAGRGRPPCARPAAPVLPVRAAPSRPGAAAVHDQGTIPGGWESWPSLKRRSSCFSGSSSPSSSWPSLKRP